MSTKVGHTAAPKQHKPRICYSRSITPRTPFTLFFGISNTEVLTGTDYPNGYTSGLMKYIDRRTLCAIQSIKKRGKGLYPFPLFLLLIERKKIMGELFTIEIGALTFDMVAKTIDTEYELASKHYILKKIEKLWRQWDRDFQQDKMPVHNGALIHGWTFTKRAQDIMDYWEKWEKEDNQ